MTVTLHPIAVLSDNYAWMISTSDGKCLVVDPGEAEPVEKALGGRKLTAILLTHHHADHIAGAERLRRRCGAEIYGPAALSSPSADHRLKGGEILAVNGLEIGVIPTPGHAAGHLSYSVPRIPALFSGDALFSGGCGRLLEGTAQELFDSLHRYDTLPDETLVCPGHEYTRGNLAFALSVDPDNACLKRRAAEVERLLHEGRPSVPVPLGVERRTNPFLRAATVEDFARLRREKDRF